MLKMLHRLRRQQSGQTVILAAAGIGVVVLIFALVISLSGLLMALSNAQDVLRDSARAGVLTAGGDEGALLLKQSKATDAAREVFEVGIGQVSGWLKADEATLSVEVLNPSNGSCSSFPGDGRCLYRPAVRLQTNVTIKSLLGIWGDVSFDLSTVAVAGIGDPVEAPPATNLPPVRTEVVTFEPTVTNTPKPTNTPSPTRTPVPTRTPWPTRTRVPTRTPTNTPRPEPTNTPRPLPTLIGTVEPTRTRVPTSTPTRTPVPKPTKIPFPTLPPWPPRE
jgi:hypothetical protein